MPPPTLLFIDLETTGLDQHKHAPVAIAALVLGGPHHDATFHAKMRPFDGAVIDPFALSVNGYDEDEMRLWPPPSAICRDFVLWIEKITPAKDLVIPAGWNYAFDERFLQAWIKRHLTNCPAYYGNTFSPDYTEVMREVKAVNPPEVIATWPKKGGMKLTFQYANHFGENYKDAHTEMADCHATRRIFLACDAKKQTREYEDYYHLLPDAKLTCAHCGKPLYGHSERSCATY